MTRDTAELTDDVLDDIPLAKSETPEELEDLALGDDYALNPEYVEMVIDAADSGDTKRLRELVGALEPADVADLMGFLTADYREELIPLLDPEALGEIISEMDENLREEVLEATPSVTLARALEELDTDDAADVIDDLDDTKRFQVLAAMGETDRAAIETTLSYEDETAGRLMQREFLAAPEYWTVGQTIDHVREAGDSLPELFFDVYVVDPTFKPVGAIPISILLRSRRETPLTELMEAVTEIPVEMDQEEVAYIFDKYHLISAPVLEPGGRLVGQITVDDIVEVIRDEAQEDILALAGVSDAGRDASVVEIVKSRLPWLMLNLATATLAVSGVAIFQAEIAQLVALAILMPIVSSLGRQRRHPDPGRRRARPGQQGADHGQRSPDRAAGAVGRSGQRRLPGPGDGRGDLPVLRGQGSSRQAGDHRWRGADRQYLHRRSGRYPGAARPGEDGP
jgi:magnesium transporter